jgi:FixJ family two-component response regulator
VVLEGGIDMTIAAKRAGVGAVLYSPEVIEIMSEALQAAIESLPEPVSATQVHYLAESILNTASRGERDVAVLVRIALIELRITPHG